MVRQMRATSEDRKHMQTPGEWSDLDSQACLRWLEHAHANLLIHGHTHRPANHALAPGMQRVVLTDWDLDGQHGPARAEVLRLSADGLHRLSAT